MGMEKDGPEVHHPKFPKSIVVTLLQYKKENSKMFVWLAEYEAG